MIQPPLPLYPSSMSRLLYIFIFSAVLSCGLGDTNPTKAPIKLAIPDYPPTTFAGDSQVAYRSVQQTIEQFTANRNPDGSIQPTLAPKLISDVLGFLEQFPNAENAENLVFRAAELLDYAGEHNNAAKLYFLQTQTFPKSEKRGTAQLHLAQLLDKQLGRQPEAVTAYRVFLTQYPDHPLIGTGESLLYDILRYQ